MSSDLVMYELHNTTAHVILNNPATRNALSRELIAMVVARLRRAEADDQARVILLRANGPVFCSGADLREMMEDPARGPVGLINLMRAIVEHPKPIVAAVAGPARAGGLGIIAACDVAIAGATCGRPELPGSATRT